MSKLIAAGTAALGGTATAVGGSYLLKNGNATSTVQDSSSSSKEEQQTELIPSNLTFQTLQDFKNNQGGDCAKKYFPNLSYSTLEGKIDGSNQFSSADLQTTKSEEGHPQSCLVVNWERTDSQGTGGKGTGNFRGVWAFVNGDKGFVMFYTATPSSTSSQFDLAGGVYILANEESGGKQEWKIKKNKEVTDNETNKKSLSDSNFGTDFPKNVDNFNGLDNEHTTNWGFVSEANDLTKLCKQGESDCPQGTPTNKKPDFKEVWKWEVSSAGTTVTLDSWSSTLASSINYLFGTEGLSMTDVFTTFKGSGKKQTSQAAT